MSSAMRLLGSRGARIVLLVIALTLAASVLYWAAIGHLGDAANITQVEPEI